MIRKKLKDFPELCDQVKDQNNILDIKNYAAKTHKKIEWQCPLEQDHVWTATVANRVSTYEKKGLFDAKGLTIGCRFCQSVEVSKKNNLKFFMQKHFPELWQYYDLKKNLEDPETLLPHVDKKLFWLCQNCKKKHFQARSKDVFRKEPKKRQKHCKACLAVRGKKYQKTMLKKHGSLLDKFPEISNEWDYDLNDFGPEDVSPSSHAIAYFKCLFGHESYPATIYNKFYARSKCPKCIIHTSEAEIRIFLELSTFFDEVFWQHKPHGKEIDIFIPEFNLGIEVDGYPWHEKRHSQDRNKTEFFAKKGIDIIRLRDKKLSITVPNSFICDLSNFKFQNFKEFCFFISESSKMPELDFSNIHNFLKEEAFREIYSQLPKPIYEKSLQFIYPEISSEFDLMKNSPFTPDMFTPNSKQKVFWLCEKGHSYPAVIGERTRGLGQSSKATERGRNTSCPLCSGRYPSKDNNLMLSYPGILQYWDKKKNQSEPREYLPGTEQEVFFVCGYGHSFQKSIKNFVKSKKVNCPVCLEKGYENPIKCLKS